MSEIAASSLQMFNDKYKDIHASVEMALKYSLS